MRKRVEIRRKLGRSDHVPEILDFFEENQEFYQVEELIRGNSLSRELLSGRSIPEEQAIHLLQAMLELLVFIHGHGVLHQDIQPRNVLRRVPDSKLMLINFPLVSTINTPDLHSKWQSHLDTVPEVTVYKAPEQLLGKPLPGSDVYAVGIIAIQALTGLSANLIAEMRQANETGEIPWRQKVQVNRRLAEVLDRMVHPDSKLRYQTAAEALSYVRQIGGTTVETPAFSVEFAPTPPPAIPVAAPLPPPPPPPPAKMPISSLSESPKPSDSNKLVVADGLSKQLSHPPRGEAPTVQVAAKLEEKPSSVAPSWRLPLLLGGAAVLMLGLALLVANRGVLAQFAVKQARELNLRKDYQGAIVASSQALQTDDRNSEAFYNRGFAHYQLNQQQQALSDLTRAIQLDPSNAKAYYYRGNVRFNLGDDQGALDDLDQAIQLDPTGSDIYLNRGTVKAGLGDEKAALADYNQAINLDPSQAPAYMNRCLTRSNLNDQDGAIQDCTTAIQLNPNYAFAYQNRGLVYRRLGNVQKAIEDLNVAIRLLPKDADPYYNRGLARNDLGDHRGAIDDFSTAIRLKPDHTLVYYDRALSRLALGDRPGAIADFEQSAKLCLDQGRTTCYKDAQFQLKKLQGSGEVPTKGNGAAEPVPQ
jgi:serine/threonine-protein kinase